MLVCCLVSPKKLNLVLNPTEIILSYVVIVYYKAPHNHNAFFCVKRCFPYSVLSPNFSNGPSRHNRKKKKLIKNQEILLNNNLSFQDYLSKIILTMY